MARYDTYYQKEQYFGKPYKGLMDFFRGSQRGTVVDLGAGQGRDSLPLADMGYTVTAVDVSRVGLEHLHRANPDINTVVGDLYCFDVSAYDYVLMNSIVHFNKNDLEKETALIHRIVTQMKTGAVFINCLLKSNKAESILKSTLKECNVEPVYEGYADYPEFGSVYHLFAVRKTSA